MDGLYIITSISDNTNFCGVWYKPHYINFSLLIFSIGFLFKVSAAPFHFWSPARGFGKSSIWDKLSNSGNTLKLLVPSHPWKWIGGWSNYSCKVISQKIIERLMGNRGSKSDMLSVKEQRVYGNWHAVFSPCLRCTLTGFERNPLIKIPYKQIHQSQLFIRLNTTSCITTTNVPTDKNLTILPWFATGFADAEGCFTIIIRKAPINTLGWQISLPQREEYTTLANAKLNIHNPPQGLC